MTVGVARRAAGIPTGFDLRPAGEDDLPACAAIWRDATNDYTGKLNQTPIPPDLARIGRLHAHLHASDPDRFWVAERAPGGLHDRAVVGFASALVRDDVWFLSMLFIRPAEQGRGLGRMLLDRVLPPPAHRTVLATATDSAQPISNGLYSSLGIVPRVPLLRLVGRPVRPDAIEPLPAGVRPVAFADVAAGAAGSDGHGALVAAVAEIDREVIGFTHPQDHRYLRTENRAGFLYRDGAGRNVAYGYSSAVGYVGPVAVLEEPLLGPVLGHLLGAVEPRGASAVWVPGIAGSAVASLVRAGLRFDGFPVLLCWDRAFADFRRYLPTSPGLL